MSCDDFAKFPEKRRGGGFAGLKPAQFRPISLEAGEALGAWKLAFIGEVIRAARKSVDD
jgi:hypothetical protein